MLATGQLRTTTYPRDISHTIFPVPGRPPHAAGNTNNQTTARLIPVAGKTQTHTRNMYPHNKERVNPDTLVTGSLLSTPPAARFGVVLGRATGRKRRFDNHAAFANNPGRGAQVATVTGKKRKSRSKCLQVSRVILWRYRTIRRKCPHEFGTRRAKCANASVRSLQPLRERKSAGNTGHSRRALQAGQHSIHVKESTVSQQATTYGPTRSYPNGRVCQTNQRQNLGNTLVPRDVGKKKVLRHQKVIASRQCASSEEREKTLSKQEGQAATLYTSG